jgi:hypothetical protein
VRRVPVDSSTLASIQYHQRRRWLDLEFRSGECYRYFQVPPHYYRELLSAHSKGQCFNHMIRNRFSYQRLTQARSPIVLAIGKTK